MTEQELATVRSIQALCDEAAAVLACMVAGGADEQSRRVASAAQTLVGLAGQIAHSMEAADVSDANT